MIEILHERFRTINKEKHSFHITAWSDSEMKRSKMTKILCAHHASVNTFHASLNMAKNNFYAFHSSVNTFHASLNMAKKQFSTFHASVNTFHASLNMTKECFMFDTF